MYICALIVVVVDIISNPNVVLHDCGDHIGAWSFCCGSDCVCGIDFSPTFLDFHYIDILTLFTPHTRQPCHLLWKIYDPFSTAAGYGTSLISGTLQMKGNFSSIHPHHWYGFPLLISTKCQGIWIIPLYLPRVSISWTYKNPFLDFPSGDITLWNKQYSFKV